MATVQRPPQMNGVAKNAPTGSRAPIKKSYTPVSNTTRKPATTTNARSAQPITRKAASVAGENPTQAPQPSAYSIMASRIANRVAEMAESITFVEKPRAKEPSQDINPPADEKRRPRKLEMRLEQSGSDSIAFSAPFLDNTLAKMLQLQNRMLKATAELSKVNANGGSIDDKIIRESAAQSAELSRIIALICAEKARQGA